MEGSLGEGPFVEGKRHGHWVWRNSNGSVWQEGPYVKGEKHGHWVEHNAYDVYNEGPYVKGEKHGKWLIRDWILEVPKENSRGGENLPERPIRPHRTRVDGASQEEEIGVVSYLSPPDCR